MFNALSRQYMLCCILICLGNISPANSQEIQVKSSIFIETEKDIAMLRPTQHQIILSDYLIIPADWGAAFKLVPSAEPVAYDEDDFNAERLARRVLINLRRAARSNKDTREHIRKEDTYARRLLLRPFQIIGGEGYSNTRTTRQKFRQLLASSLREQHQKTTQLNQVDW